MFLLHIIFDGEIILPAPSWVSYAPQAIIGRNKIQILQTKRENNWFPTAGEIEKVIFYHKKLLGIKFCFIYLDYKNTLKCLQITTKSL